MKGRAVPELAGKVKPPGPGRAVGQAAGRGLARGESTHGERGAEGYQLPKKRSSLVPSTVRPVAQMAHKSKLAVLLVGRVAT